MANPLSRLEVGIPTASFDGRFYGPYPHGDKPNPFLTAAAADSASAQATLAGISGGAPAWYTALTKGQWKAVSGGTGFGSTFQNGPRMQDAAQLMGYVPGQSIGISSNNHALTQAWCGMTVDQSRGMPCLLAGGGHNDGADNSLYGWLKNGISGGPPGWYQLNQPTPDSKLNFNDTAGSSGAQNQDGRCRSMHTGPSYVYGDSKIWLGYQSPYSSPSGSSDAYMWFFDMQDSGIAAAIASGTPAAWANNAGPWTSIGASTFPGGNDPNGAGYYSPAVYDSVNQMAWFASGFGYDRTNTWIWNLHTAGPNIGTGTGWTLNGDNPYADFSWAVCCADLGIIVMGDGGALQRFVVFEVANAGGAVNTWYYQPGASGGPGSVSGAGFYGAVNESFPWAVYQSVDHSILIMDPPNLGNTMYKLKIPMSGSAYNRSGAWIWSDFATVGDTLLYFLSNPFGSVSTDRCFNKFNVIDDMGDGTSALFYIGGIGDEDTNAGGVEGGASFNIPSYILPLPSGGL